MVLEQYGKEEIFFFQTVLNFKLNLFSKKMRMLVGENIILFYTYTINFLNQMKDQDKFELLEIILSANSST